jgi:hypothetical protein
MSRARFARPGRLIVEGRAWSGRAPVTGVGLSTDGGSSWQPATLDPETGHRRAWRRWTWTWDAVPGRHELVARATDAEGSTQPLDQDWNLQGMANNLIQRVAVTVLGGKAARCLTAPI